MALPPEERLRRWEAALDETLACADASRRFREKRSRMDAYWRCRSGEATVDEILTEAEAAATPAKKKRGRPKKKTE